jgi:hypothetical protein
VWPHGCERSTASACSSSLVSSACTRGVQREPARERKRECRGHKSTRKRLLRAQAVVACRPFAARRVLTSLGGALSLLPSRLQHTHTHTQALALAQAQAQAEALSRSRSPSPPLRPPSPAPPAPGSSPFRGGVAPALPPPLPPPMPPQLPPPLPPAESPPRPASGGAAREGNARLRASLFDSDEEDGGDIGSSRASASGNGNANSGNGRGNGGSGIDNRAPAAAAARRSTWTGSAAAAGTAGAAGGAQAGGGEGGKKPIRWRLGRRGSIHMVA